MTAADIRRERRCLAPFKGGCRVRPELVVACGRGRGHDGPHARADVPWIGLFTEHSAAVAEASRRAALVGRRYTVRLEPNNHWWQIREGGAQLPWWHTMHEAQR